MAVGALTEGFSFAYLKELVLSSMMAWISANKRSSFSEVLHVQVEPLRAQMSIDAIPTPPTSSDRPEDDDD